MPSADRAARDKDLAQRFAAALRRSADRPLRLVDIGTGTGANARGLAPVIGGDQDSLLVDDDAALLGFCAAEPIAWAVREGWRQWQPPDETDAPLYEAFSRRQRRDKGFGPALAGAATVYLGARLAAAGCAISTAASDWRIAPEHRTMLGAVIEDERRAASDERPDLAAAFARWAERRRAALGAGTLSLTIGHRDLLALPREL